MHSFSTMACPACGARSESPHPQPLRNCPFCGTQYPSKPVEQSHQPTYPEQNFTPRHSKVIEVHSVVPSKQTMACNDCAKQIDVNSDYCQYCGSEQEHVHKKAGRRKARTRHTMPAQDYYPPPPPIYYPQPYPVQVPQVFKSTKSKGVALFLCFFFGIFGFHQFYVGKIGMGLLYFFTAGLFGIGWFINFINIATGSFKDKYGAVLI